MNDGRIRDRLASTFGFRILFAWGIDRIVRMIATLVWVGVLANTILIQRPDLLYPTAFGSDISNYVAFGERMASGGDLYALSPGDRPVPADNPPFWTVPILSPPQMAGPWAAMTPLPDVVRFYGPWSTGLVGTLAVGFLFIARAPLVAVIVGSILFAGLAGTAWSGNVNAIIVPAGLLIWWVGSQPTSRRWLLMGAALVAALAVVKLGPVFLWLWLVRRRGWDAAVGGGVAVLLATLPVLAIAGLSPFGDYISTSLNSSADPTPQSIPGFLIGLGVLPDAARLIWVVMLVGLVVIVGVGRWPRAGFAAAIVGMVFLTPIVRQETISLVLLAAAPWILGATRPMPSVTRAAAPALAIAAMSVVASLLSGGLTRTSMAIENASDEPVTVRFGVSMQGASWGYVLGPGQSGWAWISQPGAILEPIRVFRDDCSLLGGARPDGVASIRIDDERIATSGAVQAAQPLPYDGRCASEMPPLGTPVD